MFVSVVEYKKHVFHRHRCHRATKPNTDDLLEGLTCPEVAVKVTSVVIDTGAPGRSEDTVCSHKGHLRASGIFHLPKNSIRYILCPIEAVSMFSRDVTLRDVCIRVFP